MRAVSLIAETSEYVVLNKPAGLIVHSDGRTKEPSVAEWIAEHYREMQGIGEPWVSPQGEIVHVNGLVHRLDRITSGILIAAKTQEMFEYLRGEFKARRVEKIYRAVVYGHVEKDSGTIVAAIERTKVSPKKWEAIPCDETHIRAAITDYTVLHRGSENSKPYTFLELRPRTGRTHQLRVHCAFLGYPIVADHLYAPDYENMLGFSRLALHAYQISFIDQRSKKVSYMAPLPDDFGVVSRA